MREISIGKALKMKNRIAGELAKLQSIFGRENSRREGSTSKVDRRELLERIAAKRASLVRIKTAISEANAGIAGVLVEMGELKAEAAFLQSLNVRDGSEVESRSFREQAITVVYDAFLKQEDVDGRVAAITTAIDALQDKLDAFNAVTMVEFQET